MEQYQDSMSSEAVDTGLRQKQIKEDRIEQRLDNLEIQIQKQQDTIQRLQRLLKHLEANQSIMQHRLYRNE